MLGPLLFIIFLNDLVPLITNSRIAMYADDIVIYSNHVTHRLAQRNVQMDLDQLDTWCDDNSMTINVKKTQSMWFTSLQRLGTVPKLELYLDGQCLEEVREYKYLGVPIDSSLNLERSVSETAKKMSHKVFKMAKLRHMMDENTAIAIYKQTILPHADYCCFLLDSTRKEKAESIQKIQTKP